MQVFNYPYNIHSLEYASINLILRENYNRNTLNTILQIKDAGFIF